MIHKGLRCASTAFACGNIAVAITIQRLVEILKLLLEKYPSTLANLTLILLFSEFLKIFKNYFFQIKKYCEG
jgi:hypothetical protein